ncbi:hypothetical protein JYG34_15860 [Pseudomonas entomophila]|uniref:hypothetical protein n=1 Tax=Pseudomonas entomophila TaxID=312306 RepID=UPI001BCFBD38|nr:hypothetical protein [Pseudomonas entomophila]QVM89501.1 hypothetical protein JYG34_15860 [Pseudomonas entomophila]
MHLHSAVARQGLLNASQTMTIETQKSCRVTVLKDKLYCVYVVDEDQLFITSRTRAGAWSESEDLGTRSLSGLPAVFTHDDKVYVHASGDYSDPTLGMSSGTTLCIYNPVNGALDRKIAYGTYGTPSVVEHRGRFHMFWRQNPAGQVLCANSTNGSYWYPGPGLYPDGAGQPTLKSSRDVVACVYQGLIHVFYMTEAGLCLIRFDGESGWSRGQLFIDKFYTEMPSVVVHDGMLIVAFADTSQDGIGNTISVLPGAQSLGNEGGIDLYRYDGHVVSSVDRSIGIVAEGAPACGVLDGELNLIFPGV